jgi:hypothetical protein
MGEMTLQGYLAMVKEGYEVDQILHARKFEKGTESYNKVKYNRKCVTLNFLYDDYKKNDNIIESTGVMMLDFDLPDFDISIIDDSYLLFYHKSFGGKGYTVGVRVTYINQENFKEAYLRIANILGVGHLYDKNAVKMTQYTVLSYDPELYYNKHAVIFSGKNYASKYLSNSYKSNTLSIEYHSTYTGDIRFNNGQEYTVEGQDFVSDFTNGYNYINCTLPFNYKIKEGGRRMYLFKYATNFVSLNSTVDKATVNKILYKINRYHMVEPLPTEELKQVVNSVFKYHERGILKPVYSKKRKIIFNTKSYLTKHQKQKIVGQEISKHWKSVGEDKIYNVIECWDFENLGKITQKKIYLNHEVSKSCVKKYYRILKEYIKELNIDWSIKSKKVGTSTLVIIKKR